MKSLKFNRIFSNALIYIILTVMSIFWVLPILWLILQSFGDGGIAVKAMLVPENFTINNYLYLFSNITGKTNPLATNHSFSSDITVYFVVIGI